MRKRILKDVKVPSQGVQPVYYSTVIGGGNSSPYPYGINIGYMANPGNYHEFQWTTTTGYLAVRRPNGTVQIFGSGYTLLTGAGLGSITFWSCAGAADSTVAGFVEFLDISGYSFNGGYTTVDLRGLVGLQYLYASYNALTSLQIGNLEYLLELDCSQNSGSLALDVRGCVTLYSVLAIGCGLNGLNVTGCGGLDLLAASSNPLTALDVTGCTAISQIDVSGCQLAASALNALYATLPTRTPGAPGALARYTNPGLGSDTPSLATAKNWTLTP